MFSWREWRGRVAASLQVIVKAQENTARQVTETYREIKEHASTAQREVDTLKEQTLLRGGQLDQVIQQRDWFKTLLTTLLIAAIIGLAALAWQAVTLAHLPILPTQQPTQEIPSPVPTLKPSRR